MSEELAGKVAIITGGAKGIGRATVERFAQEGARVVIGDVDPAAEALASALGGDVRFRRTDVASPDEIQALVDYAVAEFGRLDIMYNNAGVSSAMARLLDDEFADFHRVMGVNLLGTFLGTQRAARAMAKTGGGSIINTSSIGGVLASYGLTTYRASKAAVAQFTKGAAIELAEYGIRVNCILPGQVATGILENALSAGLPAEQVQAFEAKVADILMSYQPLKRRGAPGDVAEAALFLASARSAYVTGMLFPVDGGIIAGDAVNHLEKILRARAEAMGA